MARSTAKDDKPEEGTEFDVPSTHQRYLESLLGEEKETPVFNPQVNPSDNEVFTEDGFAGVDPVYQNWANDTDEPLRADGGADQLAEDFAEAAYDSAEEPSEALQAAYDSAHGEDGEDGTVETAHAGTPTVADDEKENSDNPKSGATGATGKTS